MSLARSASGPGGLTINTGAANSLAPASSAPQTSGLFGSASATTAAPANGGMATTGGLFGAAAQQKPAGGLFGASTTATTQPASAGGLFGSAGANTATTQPASAGGLFGGAQQQKPATGGLFGGGTATTSTTTTTQPQQQTQSGGGLFGNTQQKPAGGLFGASTAQQAQPAASTGGGLFGGATQQQPQQQQQQSGGLFGASTTTTQPASTSGLLGQSQAKPAGGLFGGAQPQQNQSTNQISAVQINYDNLRPRSRFDDLAQPIQDEISLIDKGIQRVIKMRDEIGQFMPQHEKDIEQLGRDVKFVESKFRTVQDALNRDIQSVKGLQDITKKNIGDAQLSFKATDNLKLPSHYHQTGLFAGPAPTDSNAADASSAHGSAQDLITYFNRICDDVEKYKKRLDEYRGEIERDMPGVENGLYEQIRSFRDRNGGSNGGGNGTGVHDQLSQVLSALRETGNAIVVQAGRIADTREKLSKLQAGFLESGLYTMGN